MYLVMTILDVALMVKKQENSMDSEPVISRLTPLLEELESALKQ